MACDGAGGGRVARTRALEAAFHPPNLWISPLAPLKTPQPTQHNNPSQLAGVVAALPQLPRHHLSNRGRGQLDLQAQQRYGRPQKCLPWLADHPHRNPSTRRRSLLLTRMHKKPGTETVLFVLVDGPASGGAGGHRFLPPSFTWEEPQTGMSPWAGRPDLHIVFVPVADPADTQRVATE